MTKQTEYQKFEKTLIALLAVPKSELQAKLDADKKLKLRKKKAKLASRVSDAA